MIIDTGLIHSDGRTDVSLFDCLEWNKSTNTYAARDCNCGEYKVYAIEADTADYTLLEFNVYSINETVGDQIILEDQDGAHANHDAWDTNEQYVIFFESFDDCESCQQKYVFGADATGTLGSGNVAGRRWV